MPPPRTPLAGRAALGAQVVVNAALPPRRWAGRAPLVSVVIATWNWSSVLRHSLHSALWQTYPHYEVLVVGDGCTDDSADVVASFPDPRVRWHNLPENTGSQSGPNNWGLEHARGDWVAYLGHDDVWHPTHLARLMRGALRAEADVANTLSEMVGPPGSNIRALDGHGLHGGYVPISSVAMRTREALDVGGWRDPRTTTIAIDVDLLQRMWRAGRRFTRVLSLTVFKFHASYRPNVYRDKPSWEQAQYVRRIERERSFLLRELKAMAVTRWRGAPAYRPEQLPAMDEPGAPGEHMAALRRIKGLHELR
jgi:glycosyltransferase involved in cell wall biosynthesis